MGQTGHTYTPPKFRKVQHTLRSRGMTRPAFPPPRSACRSFAFLGLVFRSTVVHFDVKLDSLKPPDIGRVKERG